MMSAAPGAERATSGSSGAQEGTEGREPSSSSLSLSLSSPLPPPAPAPPPPSAALACRRPPPPLTALPAGSRSSLLSLRAPARRSGEQHPSATHPPTAPTVLGTCFVARLPDELLIAVIANLDAAGIRTAAGVCRRWLHVVADEQCWRSAFANFFGGPPLRRLSHHSWRSEYISRLALARDWARSKQGVQFEPRIGHISDAVVDPAEGRMLVGSLQNGMVVTCHPATGKIEKSAIFCTDNQTPTQISAIKIDWLRVAVGFLTGRVALITNFRDKSTHAFRLMTGFHHGPVTALAWLPGVMSILLSGSADGHVRVWDTTSSTCVRVLQGDRSPLKHIAVDQRDHVVAATTAGRVLVWDVDIMAHATASSTISALDPTHLQHNDLQPGQPQHHPIQGTASGEPSLPPMEPSRKIVCSRGPITHMIYDAATHAIAVAAPSLTPPPTFAMSSGYANQPDNASSGGLSIWSATTGTELMSLKLNDSSTGNSSASEVTALVWDGPAKGPNETGHTLLAAGDSLGTVCLWKLPSSTNTTSTTPLSAIHVFTALHYAPITRLFIDEQKIVAGASDGKLKVIDILTGSLIRSHTFKLGRSPWGDAADAAGENGHGRDAITYLWAGQRSLIACANGAVKYWSFDHQSHASTESGSAKKKKGRTYMRMGGGGGGGNTSGRSSRGTHANTWHDREEAMRDVAADLAQIRTEINAERTEMAFLRHQNETFNTHNISRSDMTDEELLSYALMLSNEQLEQDQVRRQRMYGTSATGSATAMTPTDVASSAGSMAVRRASSSIDALSSLAASSWRSPNYTRRSARGSFVERLEREGGGWDDDDVDEATERARLAAVDPDAAEYLSPPTRGSTVIHVSDAWQLDDAELSTSAGRRRIVLSSSAGSGGGGSGGGIGSNSNSANRRRGTITSTEGESMTRAGNTAADMVMRWSPRISPVSPSVQPYYRNGRAQPTAGVMIAQRPTQADEDDELQYVLELSLHDK